LATTTGEGPIRNYAALDLDDIQQAPADCAFARLWPLQLEDQEASCSIDDTVVVWLRETDRSLVAGFEKPPFGDSVSDGLVH
jgi:hypothetical protein